MSKERDERMNENQDRYTLFNYEHRFLNLSAALWSGKAIDQGFTPFGREQIDRYAHD